MAIGLNFTVRDDKGAISRFTVNLPAGTSFDDVTLFAQQLFPLVDPLVNGAITDVSVNLPIDGISLQTTAALTSDVQEIGQFVFNAVGGFLKRIGLPTFSELKVLAGSAQIDQTDPDVAAFITAMVDGIDLTGVGGSGTIQPSDYRDADLETVDSAVEAFRPR